MDHRQKKGSQLKSYNPLILLVPGPGFEPGTHGFSVPGYSSKMMTFPQVKQRKISNIGHFIKGVTNLSFTMNWSFLMSVFCLLIGYTDKLTINKYRY